MTDERVEKYAEAIPERWVSNPGIRDGIARHASRVADAELADLRAEVEQLRPRAQAAEAKVKAVEAVCYKVQARPLGWGGLMAVALSRSILAALNPEGLHIVQGGPKDATGRASLAHMSGDYCATPSPGDDESFLRAVEDVTPCSCSAQRARATNAEAKLKAIEALADEWWPADVPGLRSSDCATELRAALGRD